MACRPDVLKRVPLFALLDNDETAVLAGQVEVKTFSPRQRIWKMGDAGGRAYVLVSGRVRVATVDEDGFLQITDSRHCGSIKRIIVDQFSDCSLAGGNLAGNIFDVGNGRGDRCAIC